MTREDFNNCVDAHADGLYRFMLKGVRDSERARDLVQDAFEILWTKREGVEKDKAKAYLFAVAYNRMIDVIRRNGRITRAEAPAESCTQSHHDLGDALHEALARLPAEQRSAVLLRDYEGCSYEEIGEITGLSASQVKIYIYRARVSLRQYIGSPDKLI